MSVIWQRTTHGVPRRREQADRMMAKLFLSMALVAILLAGGYLALAASNVHTSREIWRIHQEIAEVRRENQQLQMDIAQQSAIPILQQRSVGLGYQPAESVSYMFVGGP